ncbi:MAG: hypothetical protein C5B51_21600 [Terriglobia bacterium]|nr:MAG: hypothetical protein C5B51_21600 [Terriglobia bacterium]
MERELTSRGIPRVCVLVCALWLMGANQVWAQLGTATMYGNVTDSSGAVVVGATVSATNNDTGFLRQTITNPQGQYSLPGLNPGSYSVRVEFAGFRRAERSNITLQVDQNARIDVSLEIGQATETVEIAGQAPLIESESAALGAVVDTQKIVELPLNGRNFLQLARLVPGVDSGTQGGQTGPDGFSANGLRADQNAFQIDGTSNSNPLNDQITFRPSIDSLQEFKIETSNYSAEFGKGAGAQVNVITKSGTNSFHSTLWEFNRNNKVQARNFFDRNSGAFPCDKSDPNITTRKACAPQYNQNQFGGNLGGPIVKDKTFFFVNVEEFRQRRGGSTVTQVLTPAQRSGDFSQYLQKALTTPDALGRTFQRGQLFDPRTSRQVTAANGQLQWVRDPYAGNLIPQVQFDPVAAKMVANTTFMPLPNATGQSTATGDIINNYVDSRSNKNNTDQVAARIDHQFTAKDTLFGRFSLQDSRQYTPQTFPGFGLAADVRTMNISVNYTKVLSTNVVAELRFGHQGWYEHSGAEAGPDWLSIFAIPGMDIAEQTGNKGAPAITIAGYAGLGNGTGPFVYRNKTYQPMAILSFNKGKHYMKAGGELRYVKINSIGPLGGDGGTRGTFAFDDAGWTGEQGVPNTGNTAAAFLEGLARQKTRLVGDFKLGFEAREWGAFFQDEYKISRNLTLTLGVRYMYYTPPYDPDKPLSSWLYPNHCPSYTVCGPNYLNLASNSPYQTRYGIAGKDLPKSLAPTDKKDIGPRFGFAWRPFGSSKTSVRGGYGIFFDTVPISLNGDTLINYPQVIEDQENLSFGLNGPPVPNGLIGFRIAKPGLGNGGPGSVAQFQPGPNNFNADFKNAYIQNWNLSIQRQLPGQVVVEVAYAGSKATRLERQIALNLAEPLGPYAAIPDLSNNPNIPNNIGDSRNQLRRLVPVTIEQGVIIPLQNVFEEQSTGFSNYNGGTVRVEKRFSYGLTFLTTYTFSKAMSDNPGWRGGGYGLSAAGAQNILNLKAEKGLADLDHRQRFTVASTYQLPFARNSHGVVKQVFAGWATDSIIQLESGLPMTPQFSGDIGQMGTNQALRPDLVCNPNLPRGQQTIDKFFNTSCLVQQNPIRYGTSGRAVITGPGMIGIDLSATKNFAFGEKWRLQFRSELFNAVNHPNWVPPGKQLGTSAFGRITSAFDPRIIQFGLKLAF